MTHRLGDLIQAETAVDVRRHQTRLDELREPFEVG
jgi:hypothetical protein